MTLATHAVAGALIGAVASQNVTLALGAAFLSHFVLDTIPHWDYSLGSIAKKGININNDMDTRSKTFIFDLAKIAFDFAIGMTLTVAAFHRFDSRTLAIIILAAIFAAAPDPLQFVYWKLRSRVMLPLQMFHMWMHSKTELKQRPLLGIFSQAAIIGIILIASRYL